MRSPRPTRPKHASSKGQIDDATREQEKLTIKGQRDLTLSTQEEAAAYKQLTEQVDAYRANLLQLQGDEEGAARLRARSAIDQARELANRSTGSATPITQKEVDAFERATKAQLALNGARSRASGINQLLQAQEDRIALAVQKGAVGEMQGLAALGAARAQALGPLEQQVRMVEQLAEENRRLHELGQEPINLQLQVEASQARLAIDRLMADLDPLADKFNLIFRDAGADLFADLMDGAKPRDAVKHFFSSISKEINGMVGREIATSLFGQGKPLSGAGGIFATLFGGPNRSGVARWENAKAPSIDTSAMDQSLASLRTTGIDPATGALIRLQQAADGAAGAVPGQWLPTTGDFARLDRESSLPTTGDFARMDRTSSGEQSVMDQFRKAEESSDKLAGANSQAAGAAFSLATAAARGGDALGLLPQIIAMIQAAAGGAAGSGGMGGFIGAGLSKLFPAAAPVAEADMGMWFAVAHSGGIVGQLADRRSAPASVFDDAPRYHRGGVVAAARSAHPKLATHEVPAILMGGPKGKREEVLHASDPRHRDNLSPMTAAIVLGRPQKGFDTGGYTGNIDPKQAAGVVHGQEYVFSAQAVRAIGVDRLERMHKRAKSGQPTEELPGYADGGYVSVPGRRIQTLRSTQSPPQQDKAGDTVTNHNNHITVTVQAAQGMSRATAMQTGADVGRGIQQQMRRSGKR
jgi:hypothetical protein